MKRQHFEIWSYHLSSKDSSFQLNISAWEWKLWYKMNVHKFSKPDEFLYTIRRYRDTILSQAFIRRNPFGQKFYTSLITQTYGKRLKEQRTSQYRANKFGRKEITNPLSSNNELFNIGNGWQKRILQYLTIQLNNLIWKLDTRYQLYLVSRRL